MITLKFTNVAQVLEVPDTALDATTRTLVATTPCSGVYAPLSGIYAVQKQWRERGDMAQLAQARTVYLQPPSVPITSEHRLLINGREYRVRDVTRWPDDDPVYYECLVEAE